MSQQPPKPLRVALIALLASMTAVAATTDSLENRHPGASEFVTEVVEKHDLDQEKVLQVLAQGERRQEIIDAISRPAEAKPWHQYRPIFMTERRIREGVEFWADHQDLLDEVAERYGVPPRIIVAIIGVETSYGRITGGYPVVDALVTLAFHYPPRARFFRGELEEFILLGEEEALPLAELKGSYAGAMGLGQFISSSYRAYAVDFDEDGKRDLWRSDADAIASVANYFKAHKWRPGEAIAVRAEKNAAASSGPSEMPLKPEFSLEQVQRWGYRPIGPVDAEKNVTVLSLETEEGNEHWLAFDNFYVITRYNHSPLYAMAVNQLSEAIAARRDGS